MPSVQQYPTDPDKVDQIAREELTQRHQMITAAWKYYNGEHKPPLKIRPGQPDDNVIANLCKRIVNQSRGMLFGTPPEIQIQEGVTTPEEQKIDDILQANKWPIFLLDLATVGAVSGHAFVKIVEAAEPGELPRIAVLPSDSTMVFWDASDMKKVLFYTLHWENGDGHQVRQDIVRDGDRWKVLEWLSKGGKLELQAEQPWPYPWAPVLDWKNLPRPKEYYGESDLNEADMNDDINFVGSNTNRIIRHHAHPKTIGTGVKVNEIQETAIDSFWGIQNPEAKIFNLEMESDLRSSMAWFNILKNTMYGNAATVDMSVFADKIGQVTNFGLRVLFHDALTKNSTKQSLYGDAIEELSRRLLDLSGMGYEHDVTLHWPPPLPFSDLEQVQVIEKEMELGIVSQETAATQRGRDWESEQGRITAEKVETGNVGSALLEAFERGQ